MWIGTEPISCPKRCSETNKVASETLLIKIVCIDNDISFGDLPADSITNQTGTLTLPNDMQVISENMANRILSMQRDKTFARLGTIVSNKEKNAMWSRVEHFKKVIEEAKKNGQNGGLRIIKVQ